MKKGKFITFEGGEGSGKSTQIKALSLKLIEGGKEVILTREPGGTPVGEAIRHILVTGEADKLSPRCEALLNYAARAEHLSSVILPALIAGTWVLSDRFNDSTFAYQGGDVAPEILQSLDHHIVGNNQPDLTFLLDIDPDIGLKRAGKRMERDTHTSEDRFEKKGLSYHREIRNRFLKRAEKDKNRYVVIDASQSEDKIENLIWNTINSL